METGVEYNKQRLHKVSYFRELLSTNTEVHPSIRPLLKLSRETIERCQKMRSTLWPVPSSAILCWPTGSNDSEQFLEWVRSQHSHGLWKSAMSHASAQSRTRSATADSAETNEVPRTR